MNPNPFSRRMALCAAAALMCLAGPAAAQWKPNKPVSLVIPVAAGGGTDALARVLQEPMREALGQPVIVDARPGASGLIGSRYVARAAADGHTLLVPTNGILVVSHVHKNEGFDEMRDLEPVASLTVQPMVLLAHPSVPAKDVAQLIAYAKANPGALQYGSSGSASIGRLAMERFLRDAGIQAMHVPYKGQGQVLPALIAGEVKLFMTGAGPQVNQLAQAGRLSVLGVGSLQASALVPGAKPIADAVKGFQAEVWHVLSAPRGTPAEVIAALRESVASAMDKPEVKKALELQSAAYLPLAPQALRSRLQQEYDQLGELVRQLKVVAQD